MDHPQLSTSFITLNSVSLIVSEFIPCGVNQIVQLNVNLGSAERVQGGYYTANIDTDAAGTKLEVILYGKKGGNLVAVNIIFSRPKKHFGRECAFLLLLLLLRVYMLRVLVRSH